MNNDLISRSELKEAINTYDTFACLPDGKLYPTRDLKHPEMFVNYIHVEDVVKAIDHAPTVNLEKTSFMKGYNYGCDDGKRFYERPHGEWILTDGKSFECPFCHRLFDFSDNYCGYCGADMRGDSE